MDADVLIVGGGLNGPALALALARAGLSVAVVDARPAPARAEAGFDGRAYALALASQRLLAAVGVWPALAAHAQPILKIVTADGRPGTGASPWHLEFDAAEIEEGPMGFMVEDRFLYAAILAALTADPRITLHSGTPVVAQDITPRAAEVTLADGRRLTARVLIGADGRGSMVAARAGITRSGHLYGQTALVTAVHHTRPHAGTAWQYFMPNGPLAILPLPGGQHSSIVWSEAAANAARIEALDDADFLTALHPRFGDFLGPITLAGARFSYPLTLSLANRWVGPRLALVGDAAHGVHPIAGQGLNLGFRDVAALAEILVAAQRRGEDPGALDVLMRYEQARRFDSTLLALGMDSINTLFSNDNPALRLARDIGLAAVNAMPGLRRGFQRQAAGLKPDLPRLLQGLPL
jgi:2-octaprenyl-6-methoxyphenol hydroxylase